MTTTDQTPVADERAERLARLRERRGTTARTEESAPPATTPAGAGRAERLARLEDRRRSQHSAGHGSTGTGGSDAPAASSRPASGRRRRSPAATAKIVTVGASTTAMFGMIAGYGIADGLSSDGRAAADQPVDAAAALPDVPIPVGIPPASPTMTPGTTSPPSPPQVIVVVVDGATGRTLSTTNGTDDLAPDFAAVGASPASDSAPATAETSTKGVPEIAAPSAAESAPAPVVVPPPATVELAVPAPPPTPIPQAPAAAPAPRPQATSSGS